MQEITRHILVFVFPRFFPSFPEAPALSLPAAAAAPAPVPAALHPLAPARLGRTGSSAA